MTSTESERLARIADLSKMIDYMCSLSLDKRGADDLIGMLEYRRELRIEHETTRLVGRSA